MHCKKPSADPVRRVASIAGANESSSHFELGHQRPVVLLRRPQVLAKLGICRSALHQWLDPGSPYHVPDMPQPIKLSERSRNSYWIEEEVDLFIQQRVAHARQLTSQGAQ